MVPNLGQMAGKSDFWPKNVWTYYKMVFAPDFSTSIIFIHPLFGQKIMLNLAPMLALLVVPAIWPLTMVSAFIYGGEGGGGGGGYTVDNGGYGLR